MSARPRWADRRRGAAALAALATLLAAAPARARELWTSQDGASALELGAFYKTLGTFVRLPPALVDGTEALAAVVEAARATLPPEQAALLPAAAVLPPYGATSAHTGRVWGRLVLRERFELQVGWQVAALVASDPALLGGAAPGSFVPASAAERASRRLVDLDPVIAERGGLVLRQDLDQLAVAVRSSFADLIVGRQVLSWGSGRLWNPTDLLSPFAPTDIDREVRRGVDAVRVSKPLAATAQLELLWLPQREVRDQGGVARAQVNLHGYDIAPSVAKYVRDLVLGLDVAGDLGPLGVHGEIAWTRALDRGDDGEREQFVRAVGGVDWRPTDRLVLTGEYYFNGFGAGDPSAYLEVLRSARVARGEVFGAGRHYLGAIAGWQASELLTVQTIAVANLQDPSVLLVPALEYWAEQSVLVRAGAYLPLGRAPDPAALEALTPDDVIGQTEAWRRATGTLGLRSEYGTSPWGAFVQVAIYR